MEPVPGVKEVRTARLARDVMGLWDQSTGTVWLDSRLTLTEQRCTLVHELVHAERGDVPCIDPVLDARQELVVERESARRLLPFDELVDALRWTREAAELACVLDVDLATLRTRVATLTDDERHQLAVLAA